MASFNGVWISSEFVVVVFFLALCEPQDTNGENSFIDSHTTTLYKDLIHLGGRGIQFTID